MAVDPLVDNPFFVLELSPAASAMDIERQSKKLLAMLELGLASVTTYPSPMGPRIRTVDDVRRAQQALLDPARRVAFELFAVTPRHRETVGGDEAPGVEIAPLLWWQP